MSLICSFFISQNTVLSILGKELPEVPSRPCAVGCNCNAAKATATSLFIKAPVQWGVTATSGGIDLSPAGIKAPVQWGVTATTRASLGRA